jgi:hypothetical protein
MPPAKPFPTYKWRWLSVAPSEGLLSAPVFLGVLRALKEHEGQPFSSQDLHLTLRRVQTETATNIDLSRTPERNLFRNSGQYWRGTGLLAPVSGTIELTSIGRRVAAGQITNDEFAALIIRNTVLPNPLTYSPAELRKWNDVDLRIKPFELILNIMDRLGQRYGRPNAYLTSNELIRVVIPLAGTKTPAQEIAQHLKEYRDGTLDISDWPDCAPRANDGRLAREFLLFLANFEVCSRDSNTDRYDQKFILEESLLTDETTAASMFEDHELAEQEVEESRDSGIPDLIERRRVKANILLRSGQSSFRKTVLNAANTTCLITGEQIPDVLEAAHIIPVEHRGTDLVNNGLCLRVDIHRLFDRGKIRIQPDGHLLFHEQVADSLNYEALPNEITFPLAVAQENVRWRFEYL